MGSPAHAPSQRQLRVGELIRRALGAALARGDSRNALIDRTAITVTEVHVSPDLGHATAYVMPLGGEGCDAVLELLNAEAARLRHDVLGQLQLRNVPTLIFRRDPGFENAAAIDQLLATPRVRRDLDDEG